MTTSSWDETTKAERRTWTVISLYAVMTIADKVRGTLFRIVGPDRGRLQMSTHASAPLLAAVAYTYARKYSDDPDFTFGTGQSETWPDRASPSSSHGHGHGPPLPPSSSS